MITYLASPQTQLQAHAVNAMPVLVSFANWSEWMARGYVQSYGRRLLDSGAFSEFNSGATVDIGEYREWVDRIAQLAPIDAYAGLDDISGDYRRSLANYRFGGFPTWHDSDPPELLDELLGIAKERGHWIGVGLVPPRHGKGRLVQEILDRIPDGFHVHGWALRAYRQAARMDSVDSTNWWRDAFKLRQIADLGHLTYGECLDIVVKRYERDQVVKVDTPQQRNLFA